MVLQVHGQGLGKRISGQLPFLKIPCSLYSWGEYFSQFLRQFFITHFEDGKNVIVAFSRDLEQVNILIKFRMSGRGRVVLGRWCGSGFGGANVLRAVGDGRTGARIVASYGIVTSLSALEAATFSNTFGLFSGDEFG